MNLLGQLLAAVWSDNSGAGRLIVLATLAVGIRAAWQSFQVAAWPRRERGAVVACRGYLDAQIGLGLPETVPNGAATSSPVDLISLAACGSGTLVGERVQAVSWLRGQRVRVGLPILQGLTDSVLEARGDLGSAGRASSLCLLLGLFGTFVGLTAMVQQIQIALPDAGAVGLETWMKGIQNLRSVMDGIRTAFSTSLVGMIAAIPLVVVDGRISRSVSALRGQIDHFTSIHLLPALAPSFQDESLLERLTTQLESAFDKLESVFAHNKKALERLEGAETIFLEIIEDLRTSERNQATRDFSQLTQALNATQQAVVQVVGRLPEIADAIRVSQKGFLDRLTPMFHLRAGLGQLWSSHPVAPILLVLVGAAGVWAILWGAGQIFGW